MQFIITAYDYTDDRALTRRQNEREAHLEGIRKRKEANEVLYAGDLLNEGGQMIGSVMILNCPSREYIDKWLEVEPYCTGQVWENITIQPFAVPKMFL